MARIKDLKGQTELIDRLAYEQGERIDKLRFALEDAYRIIDQFCLAADWLAEGEGAEPIYENTRLARKKDGVLARVKEALEETAQAAP